MGFLSKIKSIFTPTSPANRIDYSNANPRGNAPPRDILAGFSSFYQIFINNRIFDPAYELQKNPVIYDVMLRDSHLYACLRLRSEYVAGLPWHMISNHRDPDQDRQAAAVDFTTEAIRRIPDWQETIVNVDDDLLRGMSVQEIEWDWDDELEGHIARQLIPRNKDQFLYLLDGNLRLRHPQDPVFGVAITDPETGQENAGDRFIVQTYDKSGGSWDDPNSAGKIYYGRGLASALYWPIFFKTTGLQLWMRWVDRYGLPTRKFTYPAHNPAMRDLMVGIAEKIKSDSNLVMPKDAEGLLGYELENLDVSRFDVFKSLISFLNEEISKPILGGTMTVQQGEVGAYAEGKVQERSFLAKVEFDRRAIEGTINRQLVKLLIKFNLNKFPGVDKHPPKFEFLIDNRAEREDKIARIGKAVEIGLPVGKAYAYETFGIPVPDDDEELLVAKKAEEFDLQGFDEETMSGLKTGEKTAAGIKNGINPDDIDGEDG